jgi:hypothetical protein
MLRLHHRLLLLSLLLLALPVASIATATSPSGRWRGSWSSVTSGHEGPLRARIRPLDHDTYRAVFVGRFFKVIPFIYPATLDRVPGTRNQYRSAQRLPLLGTYRMSAVVTPRRFHAEFRGPRDHGRFRLSR